MLTVIAFVVAVLALGAAGFAASRLRRLEAELSEERTRAQRDRRSARLELREVERQGGEVVLSVVNTGGGAAREVEAVMVVRDVELPDGKRFSVLPMGTGHGPARLRFALPAGAPDAGVPAFFLQLRYVDPLGPERTAIGYQPPD